MITLPPLVRIPSIDTFEARPPIHISPATAVSPAGLTPNDVRLAYNLPVSSGSGTIAIITAFNHPMIESDLAIFDAKFSLPSRNFKINRTAKAITIPCILPRSRFSRKGFVVSRIRNV